MKRGMSSAGDVGFILLPLFWSTGVRAEGLVAKGDYFPIGVWLQDPGNAAKYKAVGINVYVGLWEGPTEKQLAALEKTGMAVACDQNALALEPRWNKVVVGWLQNDEPDVQELPGKKGYGPPITPEAVVAKYQKLKAGDKLNRPVMLNLGQAVAWDGYFGRGVRTNKPEDYPRYIAGGDVVSFDIYPANHDKPEVAGKLSFVGKGVSRLVGVDGSRKKPVWARTLRSTLIDDPWPQADAGTDSGRRRGWRLFMEVGRGHWIIFRARVQAEVCRGGDTGESSDSGGGEEDGCGNCGVGGSDQ